MKILEIGAGRQWRTYLQNGRVQNGEDSVICIDRSYGSLTPEDLKDKSENIQLISTNIISFLETYWGESFDFIKAIRVFEHFSLNDIQYILYLLYNTSNVGADLNIVVPDFNKVFEMIQKMDPLNTVASEFNKELIQATTEIFNSDCGDPHLSIWTPELSSYYLTLEKYWETVISTSIPKYIEIDGRSWYLDLYYKRAKK